jgi:hypothetical protein
MEESGLATVNGLSEFVPGLGEDVSRFQSYTTANGLIVEAVVALGENRDGNL